MEFNTTPTRYGGRDGERGAGGKFKKPSARKPPATPYDRPPLNQSGRTSWLSKLVDPAYRIISGSANRILPSFISNAIAGNPPPLEQIDGELDNEDPATTQDVGDDNKCTSSYVISRSTEGNKDDSSMGKLNEIPEAEKREEEKPKNSTPIEGKEEDPSMAKSKGISEAEKLEEEKPKNSSDSVEISRIEQLMQGKSFSRDEITRLTKILNSKIIDEQEKIASITAEGDIGRLHLAHETPRRPNDRNQDETGFAMLGTSTPLPQTNVRDEVGASPIDIARAYMGSRRLSKGNDSYGFVSKVEKAPQNRFHPPPSPKSSTCWPAAMVQDQHGHFTPLNQRGCGLVEFPRTPYSRTLLPKSRDRQTQSQVGSRWLDPSQSSIYSQEKTRTDLPLPSYGSVGPIRAIRNKFGSESRPRKSIFLNSPNASSPLEKVGASKLFLPAAAGKNLEVGQTSGLEKYQSVDHSVGTSEEPMPLISSSNDAVRKILEQLDRHKPTPAEKAAELKLASKWKKYPGKEISDSTPNDKMKSSHLGDFGIRMNNGLAAAQSSKEGDNGTVNRVEVPQEQTTRGTDTGTDASAKAASIANVLVTTAKANTVPPFTSKAADSQVKSFFSGSHNPSLCKDSIHTDDGQKDKGATPQWPSFRNQSNGQNAATLSNSTGFQLPRNAPGQASGAKPNLPSIFVNKPNPRNATFPDNGFGFSFPVPASSGALSEPPTPSMPSPAAGVLSQPVDASTSPVYAFGTGKSAERLVFSFPSTSNASVPVDASDLKFSFGTDRKSRLSFGAIGKATC